MSVFQNAHIFMMVVSFGTETTQFLCTNIVKLNLTLPLTFCTVTMCSHENIFKDRFSELRNLHQFKWACPREPL